MGDILAAGAIQNTATSSGAEAPSAPASAEPACPECADAGFVRRARPPGHPDFGRALPCRCAENEARDEQQARLQRYSNLGPLLQVTFDALDTDRSPAFAEALRVARAFVDEPDGWLHLWGKTGSGKTSLAAAMANQLRLQAGLPALYFSVPDLLDHLRAAYSADAEIAFPQLFDKVRAAPFLVLDDLDAVNPTDWTREKLFQLLNHRANAALPTVAVTTCALQDLPPWLVDRLVPRPGLRQQRVDAGARDAYSQIGGMTRERLQAHRFETFRPQGRGGLTPKESESIRHALSMAQSFARQGTGWLTLWGNTGRGKTHLAAAIAHERLAAGDSVYFAVVPDLLDHLRASYSPANPEGYDDLFAAVRTAGLLILDDLGAHSTTPWAEEKLYQIFSYRYINVLPTVITTNVDLTDRDAIPDRILSRMIDVTIGSVAKLDTPDFRAGELPRHDRTQDNARGNSWSRRRK